MLRRTLNRHLLITADELLTATLSTAALIDVRLLTPSNPPNYFIFSFPPTGSFPSFAVDLTLLLVVPRVS